jgi:hypothetical protein
VTVLSEQPDALDNHPAAVVFDLMEQSLPARTFRASEALKRSFTHGD